MTNEQFIASVKTIIHNGLEFNEKLNKLLNSGALDIESIPENNYMLAKAAAYAIVLEAANQLKPLHRDTIKEAENISLFI